MVTMEKVFENWLDTKANTTKMNYKHNVEKFFDCLFNKGVEEVTADDMNSIVQVKVKELYIDKLIEEGYKNNSIRNHISAVKSFLSTLKANKVFDGVNFDFISGEALNIKYLKDDTKLTTNITESQIEEFKTWLGNGGNLQRKKQNGILYAIVVEFMFDTGIRLDEVFNKIYWKNIKQKYDSYGQSAWCITSKGKGDKIKDRYISDELYLKLKEGFWSENQDDLLFKCLKKSGFENLMKSFAEERGYDITPHSIRVGAATRLYRQTNDLVLVSNFLNHSDPKTTMRYIRNDRITDSGSYMLSSKSKLDESNIYDLSIEEVYEILEKRKDLAMGILMESMRKSTSKKEW